MWIATGFLDSLFQEQPICSWQGSKESGLHRVVFRTDGLNETETDGQMQANCPSGDRKSGLVLPGSPDAPQKRLMQRWDCSWSDRQGDEKGVVGGPALFRSR